MNVVAPHQSAQRGLTTADWTVFAAALVGSVALTIFIPPIALLLGVVLLVAVVATRLRAGAFSRRLTIVTTAVLLSTALYVVLAVIQQGAPGSGSGVG